MSTAVKKVAIIGASGYTGVELMRLIAGHPNLELVRLTIPRRVYTQAHMDVVAESVATVYENRMKIKGMNMIYEPKYLRFFQAKFEMI